MAKGGFSGGYGRGGGGFGGGMNMNMLKQAQKMQEDLRRAQEEAETKNYSFSAGGGAVKATVSGKREVLSVEIEPDAVDPEDIEMLQDLIVAAVNGALHAAEAEMNQAVSKVTGGMNFGF